MALHDPQPLDVTPDEELEKGSEPLSTFGRYLLFKRLRQGALGEVYRAGQLGDDAIERVVSLRLFNGPDFDGEHFRQTCQRRDAVASTLAGGPYGEIVDAGCEGGVAFVAHEFVFGRTLAELMTQSRESCYPVPLDHTLHIVDRIGIALQNAWETRLEGERITHGFLIPDFVHLSTEGEIQLTGFESSGGLLELGAATQARVQLAGYISPEVNAGHAPEASDDVYSLGAILAELVTGEPLPALNPAESSRWVQSATLAEEGTPLPDGIRHLLRESLLPRDQRIQNCEQWHKALSATIAATAPAATTFDVAFFMHSLFGDELDREADLVKAEMQAEVPPPALRSLQAPAQSEPDPSLESPAESVEPPEDPGQAAAPADPADTVEIAAAPRVMAATTESRAQAATEESPNRRRLVGAAAALLLAGAGAAYYFFGPPSRSQDSPEPIQVTVAPRPNPVVPPPPVDDEIVAGISEVAPPLAPEELESQVRSLVAQRAGDLQANLKAEYDQRLLELRRQLEEARKATAGTAEEATAPAAEPGKEPVAAETPGAEPEARQQPQAAPAEPTAAGAQAAMPEPQPAPPEPQATPPEPPAEAVVEPRPAPVEAPAEPRPAEPPAVEPGSLVSQGPGVTAPSMVRRPSVVYPPAAARLKRRATIRLRVLIDENGRPIEFEQVGKKVGLGFDNAALNAAKTTRWTPPTKDGVPVKMWVELSIDFQP